MFTVFYQAQDNAVYWHNNKKKKSKDLYDLYYDLIMIYNAIFCNFEAL